MTVGRNLVGGAWLAAGMFVGPAWAQDGSIEVSLRGTAWSSDRESTDSTGVMSVEAWARGRTAVASNLTAGFEGWIGASAGGSDVRAADVREAFVRYRDDRVDFKIGRQIIAWGRADKINPTDVFASRDHRRLVEDDSENLLGIAAAQLAFKSDSTQMTLVAAPEFRPTILPNGEYDALPTEVRHTTPSRAVQLGARFDRTGQGFDWSLYSAYVNNRVGYLVPDDQQPAIPRYVFPKQVMLGADFASDVNGFGLRGELAFTASDLKGYEAFAGGSVRVSAVLGVEKSIAPNLNLNVQIVALNTSAAKCPQGCGSTLADVYRHANGLRQFSWQPTILGATAHARYEFKDGLAYAEATVVAYDGGGALTQLRAGYKLTDEVAISAGVDVYSGRESDAFSAMRSNTGFFVGLRQGF